MNFALHAWRFYFTARDRIHFPEGNAANTLRGALGSIFRQIACDASCDGPASCPMRGECVYARYFEPVSYGSGPSGLRDHPRPFVFRAWRLGGRTLHPEESFHFDLHVFQLSDPPLRAFADAFAKLADCGVGPGRGRAVLDSVWQLDEERHPAVQLYGRSGSFSGSQPIRLSLVGTADVNRVEVRFLTPTEIKGHREPSPPKFLRLFGRIRDRLSNLAVLYGAGPLAIDFKDSAVRAAEVCLLRHDLRWIARTRRSSRTGQAHPLGGFVGEVEYSGRLGEFLPYLEVAEWTGVGRQTVWGKGEIQVTASRR